jgi:hypothetical protein
VRPGFGVDLGREGTVRAESPREREARHWLAQRSFYHECMECRDGVLHIRDVLLDLRDCEDFMEPELCGRLRCGSGATYAAGARKVLDAHLVIFSPHGGDAEEGLRRAEAQVLRRVEFPAEL